MHVGVISHGVAAAGFLVLFLLLLTSWRGRLKGALLLTAVLVELLWATAAVWYVASEGYPAAKIWYLGLESARSAAWLVFLLQLLEPLAQGGQQRLRRYLTPGLLLFAALLVLADVFPPLLASLSLGVGLRFFGHVVLAVCGLVLIEQLFRNTRPEQRWATKFLYLGIGALFAYDFYLYADALLFKQVDPDVWHARGLVNAMAVPLLAVAAARNPHWSLDVFVSRRMVLHSVSILGAGLYLLLMAGVGYYIQFYGGTWGTAVQAAFLFGAGLLLLVMMFSGQMRAGLKVFLSKHFFSYKYDYREEWLKFIDTLATAEAGEPSREHAIRAVAEIVDCPGGLLWTRTESGQYRLTAGWNMGEHALPAEPGETSLVQFLKRRQSIVEFDRLSVEPEFYEDLRLPDWLVTLSRAWIVVPLLRGDELQGFIVLARPRAPRQINWEDRDLLRIAGQQVASYLRLLETTDALMNARQFEAFNRLSAYVVHDLKNVTAQLALVVSNAARYKDNPRFVDDAIRTVDNATVRMNRMLGQLRKGAVAPAGEIRVFALEPVLREVVAARALHPPVPRLTASDPTLRLSASRDRCAAVLEHLVQNAQEATATAGRVEIRLHRDGPAAVIEISDDGCGMDPRFVRERLFRPFATTKGNAGMGIGVYESREFVLALGGEIDVASQPGVGTTFYLRLPAVTETVVAGHFGQTRGSDLARADQEVADRRG